MEMETSRKKKEKGNGESGTKGMQKDSPYDLMDISWNLADDTCDATRGSTLVLGH